MDELKQTLLGLNEDRTPNIAYEGRHVVITAPHHVGTRMLDDGTVIDVTPRVVAVPSQEHAIELVAKLDGIEALDGMEHPHARALRGE